MKIPEPRLTTNGDGYEQFQAVDVDGEQGTLQHHRVLAWAWGELKSPFHSGDVREVHHDRRIPWLNTEANLEPLTPAEHCEVDPRRAQIEAPWNDVGKERLADRVATDGGL